MRPSPFLLPLILVAAVAHAEDVAPGDGGAKPDRQQQAKAASDKAFADADANKDAKLDRAEFGAAATSLNAARAERAKAANRPAPPEATVEQLDGVFKKADANADATLDMAEFGEAMKAMRPKRDKPAEKPAEGTPAPAPAPAPH